MIGGASDADRQHTCGTLILRWPSPWSRLKPSMSWTAAAFGFRQFLVCYPGGAELADKFPGELLPEWAASADNGGAVLGEKEGAKPLVDSMARLKGGWKTVRPLAGDRTLLAERPASGAG